MNKYFTYETKMGIIGIEYNDNGVVSVKLPSELTDNDSKIIDSEYVESIELKDFFDQYFNSKTPDHKKIKLDIKVTDFQKKVYDLLLDTKAGTLLTYGDVAKLIGCGSPRAIGQALKKNPIPVIVPCHRIVGSGWEGGYSGQTSGNKMEFKRFLIQLEQKNREI